MWKWVKRILLGALVVLLVAVGAGAAYEAVARRRAWTEFPPAGRMVDIGGRRIELDCRGSGSPTVVLEAGLDMNGPLAWALVHDSIATFTRVCGYSRAGIMWSDDKPGPHDADRVATDLAATLDAAGEQGPFVMAGHSLGGPYVMTFTRHYPSRVAGLVFVDASHPDQVARFAKITDQGDAAIAPYKIAGKLAWTGLVRLLAPTDRGEKIPRPVAEAMAAYVPTSLGPMLAELEVIDSTFAQGGQLRDLGDRPLVVLTAMAPMDSAQRAVAKLDSAGAARFKEEWRAMHEDEASWSTRSEHVLVTDATHYIQVDRPDVVIGAVRKVVEMVRADAATPSDAPTSLGSSR